MAKETHVEKVDAQSYFRSVHRYNKTADIPILEAQLRERKSVIRVRVEKD